MTKHELLYLLDDPDVREKILSLVNKRETSSTPQNLFRADDDARRLKDQLRARDAEISSATRRANDAESQLATLRGEILQLKNSLSQVRQQSTQLQREADDADRRAENYRRQLNDANEKISQLESSVDNLNAQLKQGFARGRELFEKYRQVNAHARQLLSTGVFVRDDFTSFVCGGAQSESLEKIWDVLKGCVLNGQRQDAEILWQVFEYCLELVNSSRAQAGFSVLPVKVGDRFDADIHSEGLNSRAQGKISVVCLPGFRNDYNGRVVRKSIVQV